MWKRKILFVLKLRHLDQYIEEDASDDDDSRTCRMLGGRKVRAACSLRFLVEYLE